MTTPYPSLAYLAQQEMLTVTPGNDKKEISLLPFTDDKSGITFALSDEFVSTNKAMTINSLKGDHGTVFFTTLRKPQSDKDNGLIIGPKISNALLDLLVLCTTHSHLESIDADYAFNNGIALSNIIEQMALTLFNIDMEDPAWQSIMFAPSQKATSARLVGLIITLLDPILPSGKLYAVMPECVHWQEWIEKISNNDPNTTHGAIFGEPVMNKEHGWEQDDLDTVEQWDFGDFNMCFSDSLHAMIRIR